MSSFIERIIDSTVYHCPDPPPRKRDPSKPLQLICPGFPRSATESLQVALLQLGYDHTYHGWDVLLEEPHRLPAWARLGQRKFDGEEDGDCTITAEEFDALIGHSQAVIDTAASVFAAELITAYPDAKVILNTRSDLDAWNDSCVKNVGEINENWSIWFSSFFTSYGYWSWKAYERYLHPGLFRAPCSGSRGEVQKAIKKNGKWIYREHCAMIRGMVPKERLLEWSVEDGWQPLCEFLGKPVPDEPFPRTNGPAGFAKRVDQWFAQNRRMSIRNFSIFCGVLAGGVAGGMYVWDPSVFKRMSRGLVGLRGYIGA